MEKISWEREGMYEIIQETDRQYFKEHPNKRYYDRCSHPSEVPETTSIGYGDMVRVFQVTPGIRVRLGFKKGSENKLPKKLTQFERGRQILEAVNRTL
jgi:hypothetical protein